VNLDFIMGDLVPPRKSATRKDKLRRLACTMPADAPQLPSNQLTLPPLLKPESRSRRYDDNSYEIVDNNTSGSKRLLEGLNQHILMFMGDARPNAY
jgi:hypothetical protein